MHLPGSLVRNASTVLLLALVSLAGCSGERWLRAEPNSIIPPGGFPEAAVDPRPLVSELTSLTLERTPGGVIVRAEALAPTQGYWAPDLIDTSPSPDAEGAAAREATFDFRAQPPVTPQPSGPVQTRRLSAAAFLSNARLEGIRTITVVSASNSRSLRR